MQIWPFSRHEKQVPAPAIRGVHAGQEVLIFTRGSDDSGLDIMRNICTPMLQAKISFTIVDIERGDAWPALDTYGAVILCAERLWEIDIAKIKKITDYVHSGGGLITAQPSWNEQLCDLFGVPNKKPEMRSSSGMEFTAEIVPGIDGLRVGPVDWFEEYGRFDYAQSDLARDCVVLASDRGGAPIIWRRQAGGGRVVVWNCMQHCHALRGVFLHTLMGAMGTSVAAIGGFALFHVDDFPASVTTDNREPVKSEFSGIGDEAFFFEIWHRDMMQLRHDFGLAYTWYTVMNYFDVDTTGADGSDSVAVRSGAPVLKQRIARIQSVAEGDEYGFHGYNHQPLICDYWPDIEVVRDKLVLARDLWETTTPWPTPTSWVPANNWFERQFLPVVVDVFPELTAVCTTTHSIGDFKLGEYREFGPEPWMNSIVCLPRETFGYVLSAQLELMMLSQVAAMGIWTHFVHPDDLFDIPDGKSPGYCRNPKRLRWRAANDEGKEGMFPQLYRWIGRARDLYPWLDFTTTSDGEKRLRRHIDNMVTTSFEGNTISISATSDGLYYIRTESGVTLIASKSGEVLDSRPVDNGTLHVVRCSAGETVFAKHSKGNSGL